MNISEAEFEKLNTDMPDLNGYFYGQTVFQRATDLYNYLDEKVELTVDEILDKENTQDTIFKKIMIWQKRFVTDFHPSKISPNQFKYILDSLRMRKLLEAMRIRCGITANIVRDNLARDGYRGYFN